MTDWRDTSRSTIYKEALKAVEDLESPAVGFTKSTNYATAASTQAALLKQNNLILQLLVSQGQKIGDIYEEVDIIKRELRSLGKKPEDLETSIQDLTGKLEGLKLGPEQPRVPKQRPRYFVFEDPLKIFKEEQEKK